MGVFVRDGRGNEQTMRTDSIDGELVSRTVREWQNETPLPFHRFLDTTGDGTGTVNAVADYSLGSIKFKITPGIAEIVQVQALLIHVRGTSVANSNNYGPIGALTNGVSIYVQNAGGPLYRFTDANFPVKTTADWAMYGGMDAYTSVFSSGDEWISVLLRFDLTGTYTRLERVSNEELVVELSDDFSGLTRHTFMAYGMREDATT